MDKNYRYSEIMEMYRQVLSQAEEKIGFDSHQVKFTKKTDSIDLKVIDAEIKEMFDAGKEAARLIPNGNFLNTLKNIVITSDYKTKLTNIMSYAESIKPELVHRYALDKLQPADTNKVELNAHIVLADLYNAFNQGVVSVYNGKSDAFFNIFSTERVYKKAA